MDADGAWFSNCVEDHRDRGNSQRHLCHCKDIPGDGLAELAPPFSILLFARYYYINERSCKE
jgi:hypothetical protein